MQQQQEEVQDLKNHQMRQVCNGTIKQFPAFKPEDDAQALRKAMKGLGTDETAIIGILTQRCNEQRQEISQSYKALFDRDLISDIKSELSGRLEDVIKGLLLRPRDYSTYCLRKAVKGLGTDEEALVEILSTRTNAELIRIKAVYEETHSHTLDKDVSDDTSGNFKKLLGFLLRANRDESCAVDASIGKLDAQHITDGDIDDIIRIFCTRNFMQLCFTFEEFQKINGKDILDALNDECGGDVKMALKCLVRVARNTPEFFAHQLHSAMKGVGTNDSTLIRIVVSRSEIDLAQIKIEFERMYKKTLSHYIKDDTSGDYKRTLLLVVEGN